MWARSLPRRASPSVDRQMSRAARAAAALVGARPVVKMKLRARLMSRSIHDRGPATYPPWEPSAFDRVPTRRHAVAPPAAEPSPNTAWASSSTSRALARAHISLRPSTSATSPSMENTVSVITSARPGAPATRWAASSMSPWRYTVTWALARRAPSMMEA